MTSQAPVSVLSSDVVTDWSTFRARWAGVRNFLLAGDCVPMHYDLPPLPDLIDEMRRDAKVRLTGGKRGSRLEKDDISAEFRPLPIEQAMERPFALAHFALDRFDKPGKCLHGFYDAVLRPWQMALATAGFTWTRCSPIIFISGKGCATNYHMDLSHVLAWQRYGRKRFCSFQDPTRWAPAEVRRRYALHADRSWCAMPDGVTDRDVLAYDMAPGSALWNALLTPHWVEAGDEVAMSINLSHEGLRLSGQLCPHEAELTVWRDETATAPAAAY